MNYLGIETEELIRKYVRKEGWIPDPGKVRFLAAGEYNENYLVSSATGEFVFRINHGSQLGIERQSEYEFAVLRAVAESGVTPQPFFCDQEPEEFPGGVMLMEFLPGRRLEYRREAHLAADIFARIHRSTQNRGYPALVRQPRPISDIAAESIGLIERFPDHPLRREKKLLRDYHEKILRLSEEFDSRFERGEQCVTNTEVNSGNFIVDGGRAYLVDWEKAVISTPFQDLGHFVVETSTRWKDSYVFTPEEKRSFLEEYARRAGNRGDIDELEESAGVMERTILLRALSWCFMAWYEYRKTGRALKDPVTEEKVKTYLGEIEWFLR